MPWGAGRRTQLNCSSSFSMPQGLGSVSQQEENIYMLLSCVLFVRTSCCHWMPTITRQGGYGGQLRQRWTVARWSNLMFSDVSKFVLDFHYGRKSVCRELETLQTYSHDRTRPLWRWKCHDFGRDHDDWENRTPQMPGECHWALLQRQCHWAYCCALRPSAWECSHFQGDNSRAHRARVFKITCKFAESRLSHAQRSPQTCLQFNICGTSSGGVSRDGLKSHKTSTSSPMHSKRNNAGSPRL